MAVRTEAMTALEEGVDSLRDDLRLHLNSIETEESAILSMSNETDREALQQRLKNVRTATSDVLKYFMPGGTFVPGLSPSPPPPPGGALQLAIAIGPSQGGASLSKRRRGS